MRMIRYFFIVILLAAGCFFLLEQQDISPAEEIRHFSTLLQKKDSEPETKEAPAEIPQNKPVEDDISGWIGETSNTLIKDLGEPLSKDLSAYGYRWWVYADGETQYLQFGVSADGIIKTVFATGEGLEAGGVQLGDTYGEADQVLSFGEEVTYKEGASSYTFRLNEDDMKMRPLIQLTDDLFMQTYFDTFTDELSSIRVLTADTLLKQRPYEVMYRGTLPEAPELSDGQWEEVEAGMEQQIFEITNVIRNRHKKAALEWEEQLKEVAFLHSKDMAENDYFSHYSLNGNGLKERLAEKQVVYLAAGENIAAQYTDAAAAMEGWLNSEGHREALLNDDYTHLGVGVYRFYYTQNFLSKQ
jgi:uncharacterized protein YkwD